MPDEHVVHDCPISYLDDVVHELKSEEAAEINNGGRDSQIEFLAGVGWKPEGASNE